MLHSFDPANKHGVGEAVIEVLKHDLDIARTYLALGGLPNLSA